jgi:hypothetical protein
MTNSKCENCSYKGEYLGRHIAKSRNCEYPKLSEKEHSILTGLLMGDGSVNRDGKTPYFRCKMINKRYLVFLDNLFGKKSNGIYKTKKESKNQNSAFEWRSMSLPDLECFCEWYTNDGKVWPKNIQLNPDILKNWYVSDGTWTNSGTSNHISISAVKEKGNERKINKYFNSVGLPEPYNYVYGEHRFRLVWSVEQSKKLWGYMGKPLPGFEYKWPEEYRKS